MNVTINYLAESKRFCINPGMAAVPAIGEWLGWRRLTNGTYTAECYPSSVLSVKSGPSVTVHWAEHATAVRDSLLNRLNGARKALSCDWTLPDTPTARKPRKHQLQAVQAMQAMGMRVLLSDKMGLGKTSSVLWAAHECGIQRILVVCPVSVKFNWQNEILTTLGDGWLSIVIDGTSKKRADQIAEATSHARGSTAAGVAVIINYDLLLHLSDEQSAWLRTFAANGLVIFDESHYLKSGKAKRTHLSQDIAARAKHVCCLTGTPIRNMADDLFTQVELVRPGTWTSYRDFARRYLVIQSVKFGKRDVQKVVGTKNLAELNAVMNTLQISREKHECIDLPPKVYTYPELELEGDLLKLYNAMKLYARMELKNVMEAAQGAAPITVFDPRAKSAVEQAMRCEQIAQGFVGGIPDPVMAKMDAALLRSAEKIEGRPNELIFPGSPKLMWLMETIESVVAQGGAPLVFTRFNAPMAWIARRLEEKGIESTILHGGLSAIEKSNAVLGFQNGINRVLIAQVKMAEGWNAQCSQDVLFLGRDWSPAINAQAEDRAHRMGQKGTVNVQIPIVRKTVEVMIHKRLLDKSSDAAQALRSVTIEELMEAL